jgi:hypothetical protein
MSCIFDGLQIIVIVAGIVWSYGALDWAQRDGYRRVDRLRREHRTRILNGELWKVGVERRVVDLQRVQP